MEEVILTSAYLGPVQYYSKLYGASRIFEERCDHYVKQTYRNRCVIAGANGPLALTLPIEHGDCLKPLTRDIRLSEHGNWRHLHWNALVSAYDKSPFFEYYADDLRPFYEKRYDYLVDFNEGLRKTICDLLDLHPVVVPTTSYMDAAQVKGPDFRETIRPKVDFSTDATFCARPYYQVFAEKHGFLPNLSILDLLFNEGPMTRMVLRDSIVR